MLKKVVSVESELWLANQTPNILRHSTPRNSRGICAIKCCKFFLGINKLKPYLCVVSSYYFSIYWNRVATSQLSKYPPLATSISVNGEGVGLFFYVILYRMIKLYTKLILWHFIFHIAEGDMSSILNFLK